MNQVLNFYKNNTTGKVIQKWETKRGYENHSFEFNQTWKLVGGLEA